MCRWAAWSGQPRFMESLVCDSEHSLISQARHAQSSKTTVNADGFGMAWYGVHAEPCVYKDVHPAWSDPNLNQLAHHICAPLLLAHVRASTGGATSYHNSHPFTCGRWCFMHNGQIGGYDRLRKTMDGLIPDHLYGNRNGSTDSEALFLIAVGQDLDADPLGAMQRAVCQLETLSQDHGEPPFMRFTAAWSDGQRLFAARYASDHLAPTLYHRCFGDGVMVVSEPLDEDLALWTEVPKNTALMVEDGKLSLSPFESRQPTK